MIGTRHEEIFWGDVNILQPGRFGLNSMSNEEMYPQTKKNVIKYYESIKDLENSA